MTKIPKKYRTVRKIQEGEFVAQICNMNFNEVQKKFFINVYILADDKPVVRMGKAYDIENGIVECTDIGRLVEEFELLNADGEIVWNDLYDSLVLVEVGRNREGKPSIKAIHPYIEDDSDAECCDLDYYED